MSLGVLLVNFRLLFVNSVLLLVRFHVLLVIWRLNREFPTFTREFCRSLPYFIKITIQTRVDRMDLFWYYSYSG
ncbi:hypothetical protein [Peribacillus frigoritolerans]|uniref:hypothetical protein n=1 Tax=Peribacillus frigoritolerans TaxID=450367 RepID=UPI002E1D87E7|nr:hypothetical protein [Peribacillus frigoritolerans]